MTAKNHCIRCGTGEVHQHTSKDPNVCLWCRLGDSPAYRRLKTTAA